MMQPQQQTVVTSAGPVQPVYVSQTAAVVSSYRKRQSTVIGILLIIAGALSILFNIVDLAVGTQYRSYYSIYYTLSSVSNGVVCHGFWCGGVMIIIAGGFGIGAARHKTRCMIVTFMVLAIIGAVLAVVQLIVAGDGARKVYYAYGNTISSGCFRVSCNDVRAVYAMEILLALLGVGEFGVCLWGSILCCVTGGCYTPAPTAVVMVPAGQPQVTVVSQQQQQPVAMAPPQMYPPQPGYPGGYAPQ